MEIETPRLRLRPWRLSDRSALLRHADNPRIARNLTDVFPSPYTEADADAWLGARGADTGPTKVFAIEIAGEAAGSIGIHAREDVLAKTAEIGYWLAEIHWGQGYATEALKALIPYAFTTFGLHRLEAYHFGWNPASGRVLEKAGLRLEGCLRERICKNAEFTDAFVYGLLRDEAF
jgi:ribosomal-protein-alanine N-acetyltransferase